jgi:hypothetical protein
MQVAVLRDNTYQLIRNIWNDVQEDWPFYTEQERQLLKRSVSNLYSSTIFQHPAALYCSMGFACYVTTYVQLCCVSCHSLTLHVSAYIAILRCVVYFYFHMPEGI